MSAIDIPDPLPPAITPPRTVIEFLVDEDLDEFGDTGLVARTWHWVLHGGRPGPISQKHCRRAAAAPSPWAELNKARFICWLCTASPGEEVPLRFRPWVTGPEPTVTEEGAVTVTMREVFGRPTAGPW